MMTGRVTAQGTAVVAVSLFDLNQDPRPVDAVIDTGFNGFLTLPLPEIVRLGFAYEGTVGVVLGDGAQVRLDAFAGSVLWDGEVREGLILAAEGSPLIGMALLAGSRLCLDVTDGGPVTIERLP